MCPEANSRGTRPNTALRPSDAFPTVMSREADPSRRPTFSDIFEEFTRNRYVVVGSVDYDEVAKSVQKRLKFEKCRSLSSRLQTDVDLPAGESMARWGLCPRAVRPRSDGASGKKRMRPSQTKFECFTKRRLVPPLFEHRSGWFARNLA
jgi:hypothetical protein